MRLEWAGPQLMDWLSEQQECGLSASTQQFHFGLLGVWEVVTLLETGLVLCPHESLCHLHVSPSGRTVMSGTVLLVSISSYGAPAPQPCDDQITSTRGYRSRALAEEKKVARRVCRGQGGLKISQASWVF